MNLKATSSHLFAESFFVSFHCCKMYKARFLLGIRVPSMKNKMLLKIKRHQTEKIIYCCYKPLKYLKYVHKTVESFCWLRSCCNWPFINNVSKLFTQKCKNIFQNLNFYDVHKNFAKTVRSPKKKPSASNEINCFVFFTLQRLLA